MGNDSNSQQVFQVSKQKDEHLWRDLFQPPILFLPLYPTQPFQCGETRCKASRICQFCLPAAKLSALDLAGLIFRCMIKCLWNTFVFCSVFFVFNFFFLGYFLANWRAKHWLSETIYYANKELESRHLDCGQQCHLRVPVCCPFLLATRPCCLVTQCIWVKFQCTVASHMKKLCLIQMVGWSIKKCYFGESKEKIPVYRRTGTTQKTWCVFQCLFEMKDEGSCPSCFPLRLPVQMVLASSVAPVRVADCTRTSEEYWLFPQATIVVLIYMDGGQRVQRLPGFLTTTTTGSRYVDVKSVLHQYIVRFKCPAIIVLLLSRVCNMS